MPKKLQTYFVIKTEKDSIYIVEPDLKSIKNKILRALKNNYQENLKPQIAIIIDKWQPHNTIIKKGLQPQALLVYQIKFDLLFR